MGVGSTPVQVAACIKRAAADLRTDPGLIIWTYPQGDHYLPHTPLKYQGGVLRLIQQSGPTVATVCAGIRYEMYRRDRPMCAVAFENLEPTTERLSLSNIEECANRALNRANRIIESESGAVQKLF
jgi:hypothetical protein